MNKTRSALASCIVVILIFLIGMISFVILNIRISEENYVLTEELNNTKADLNNAYEILLSTSNKLTDVKEDLKNEITKNSALQTNIETANTIIESLKSDEYIVGLTVTDYEIDMIAKTVWGEGRGLNNLEKSAIIWCILNRVDAGYGTIAEVITAPDQFHGYSSNYLVNAEIRMLVEDVIVRWKAEKICDSNFGRTLPSEYLWFHGDGKHNYFRNEYSGNYNTWDWDCWNPYS